MEFKDLYKYKVSFERVVDGDSIIVDIDLGFGITMKSVSLRLYGIDTPEIKGLSKLEGVKSRDMVIDLIKQSKSLAIESIKDTREKYGRVLAILHIEKLDGTWINCNDYLCEMGLAKKYDK